MTQPLIEIKNLYKVFGPRPDTVMSQVRNGISKADLLARSGHVLGLKEINLDIFSGEIFVIMGLSGSGKSTLIRHFNRLIDPTEGQVIIDNEDIMTCDEKQLRHFRRKKMAMVFQRFGLLPHYTVLENVAYGLQNQNIPKKQREDKARQWLDDVGLKGYEYQYPSQLSGGQQQRVGLARALCTDADILLMDEAFSALDPLIRSEMQEQLIQLQQRLHKTIVFITHDLDEALRLGDRIAILREGEVVQVGTSEDILLRPADDYIEKFICDVNRVRALTVKMVMQPVSCQITAEQVDEAFLQLEQSDVQSGFYVENGRFLGVVTRNALLQSSGTDQSVKSLLQSEGDAVMSAYSLQEVLETVLKSSEFLPVVTANGELVGELSKDRVLAILAAS